MATITPKYGLIKPDANEVYNIGQFNTNADIIDTALGGIKTQADNLATDLTTVNNKVTNLTTDVTNAKTDINNIKTDVTSIETNITNIGGDTTQITQDLTNLEDTVDDHVTDTNNPHNVTATQLGINVSGDVSAAVVAHNSSTTSHSDIRTAASNAQTTANEAKALAEGRSKAKTYMTYTALVADLNAQTANSYLSVGDALLVATQNVPDLWVYRIDAAHQTYTFVDDATFLNDFNTNTLVKVGYWALAESDSQKVTVGDFVKKTGDTMTGALKINCPNHMPMLDLEGSANSIYFTDNSSSFFIEGSPYMTIRGDFGIFMETLNDDQGIYISNLADPSSDYDAVNMKWVNQTCAPKSHAATTNIHGIGDTTKYGHLKLSDAVGSTLAAASGGTAATPLAVKTAVDGAVKKIGDTMTGGLAINTTGAQHGSLVLSNTDRGSELTLQANGNDAKSSIAAESTLYISADNELYLEGVSKTYVRNLVDAVNPGDAVSLSFAQSQFAPKVHAVTATDYGLGNGTLYGHLKLSDSLASSSGVGGGIAATPYAVKSAYDRATAGAVFKGTSTTAAATAAKVMTINDDYIGTMNGMMVEVTFSYTNTATAPTLATASGSRYPIRYGGVALSSPGMIAANIPHLFKLDSTNGWWNLINPYLGSNGGSGSFLSGSVILPSIVGNPVSVTLGFMPKIVIFSFGKVLDQYTYSGLYWDLHAGGDVGIISLSGFTAITYRPAATGFMLFPGNSQVAGRTFYYLVIA